MLTDEPSRFVPDQLKRTLPPLQRRVGRQVRAAASQAPERELPELLHHRPSPCPARGAVIAPSGVSPASRANKRVSDLPLAALLGESLLEQV